MLASGHHLSSSVLKDLLGIMSDFLAHNDRSEVLRLPREKHTEGAQKEPLEIFREPQSFTSPE
jgi:hypothetical protein